MKNNNRIVIILSLLFILILSIPSPVYAKTFTNDKVVLGGSFRLKNGDTLDGSLAVFGGQAILEDGSLVTGDIVITGGTIDIDGDVEGDITAIGGSIKLGDSAVIYGDIATIGSSLNRSDDATIKGNLSFDIPSDFSIPSFPILPGINAFSRPGSWSPNFNMDFKPISKVLGAFFQSITLAALAILLALFLETPTKRIINSIIDQPVVAGGIGLLSLIVIPGILLVMAITIILLPISLLGFIVLFLSLIFGWISIGIEVGNRISTMFKQNWATPIAAGIGTFIMTIIVKFFGWIPCIGWIMPTIVIILGLGGIFLSRFGTKEYVQTTNKIIDAKIPDTISDGD